METYLFLSILISLVMDMVKIIISVLIDLRLTHLTRNQELKMVACHLPSTKALTNMNSYSANFSKVKILNLLCFSSSTQVPLSVWRGVKFASLAIF